MAINACIPDMDNFFPFLECPTLIWCMYDKRDAVVTCDLHQMNYEWFAWVDKGSRRNTGAGHGRQFLSLLPLVNALHPIPYDEPWSDEDLLLLKQQKLHIDQIWFGCVRFQCNWMAPGLRLFIFAWHSKQCRRQIHLVFLASVLSRELVRKGQPVRAMRSPGVKVVWAWRVGKWFLYIRFYILY